ncbi:Pectinesterase 2 [Abeliophyllum distichum]|uniref:Pectinesterase n=1 Tax=Abeliophyllum distichum TaxID=126358 RepID=A0ABD1VAT3_9LAMI
MEARNAIKNSQFFRKLTKNQRKTIIIVVYLPLASLLIALLFKNPLSTSSSSSSRIDHQPLIQSPPLIGLHPFIKKACATTLYPSLCLSSLASIHASKNATSFHRILEMAINRTVGHVKSTRRDILAHFRHQDLKLQEKNALKDCMEMLDQTLYELAQAVEDLRISPSSYVRISYGNIKTLLSAAMTNENTCIDGFSDLEELNSDNQTVHKEHLQNLLTPISRMISNSLAMIKYVENKAQKQNLKNPRTLSTKLPENDEFQDWVHQRRTMQEKTNILRPDVIVNANGTGNYTTIGEAIAVAPNMSMNRFMIRIKSGIYKENVLIPREKINIMLVGDGMNSTIIMGWRNFADGFSTFASATLTVVGDKFLAANLTIINTAGPEKHQAVALRVTSNAAFFRCEIFSHQDTLYAHSLRQFYSECSIQGTIDFIFGNAAAIFQNCTILVRKPNPGQRNVITAQGREDPNQNTGISLQNCTIEAASEFNVTERKNFITYLGRPWRNYSRTIIMNSYIGDLIHPLGWCKWDVYSNLGTVDYMEYMNSGPGSDTKHRISWTGYRKNCTEDIARQFTVEKFLHGAEDWLQSTVLPIFNGA